MSRFPFRLFLIGMMLFASSWGAQASPQSALNLAGYWKTQDGDGIVQFYPCGDRFCARFSWLKVDSAEHPSVDDKNPDESLRDRPLCGMTFMGGFKQVSPASFEDGWIYSPHHGSMFSANISLAAPDTLVLHGFMFIPLLGEDQVWHRTDQPASWCAAKKEAKAQPALEKKM